MTVSHKCSQVIIMDPRGSETRWGFFPIISLSDRTNGGNYGVHDGVLMKVQLIWLSDKTSRASLLSEAEAALRVGPAFLYSLPKDGEDGAWQRTISSLI
ncbi:hypothetical protein AAFF_G00398330 [Aldrovandia affinis]|uniref:Uncharacterized protein n=1 Tax=Aldrovandia affinis TaxID=143900 RepID=A0AAD7WL70_9TELE|nr:hypothetical protein AAFF_G00398330 [Aldrovandia affinis]